MKFVEHLFVENVKVFAKKIDECIVDLILWIVELNLRKEIENLQRISSEEELKIYFKNVIKKFHNSMCFV